MHRKNGMKMQLWALATLAMYCPASWAVLQWAETCGGRMAVVGLNTLSLTRHGVFRLIFTEEKAHPHRVESVKVEDPLYQVDHKHPFEVAFNDLISRERLIYAEESLKKRGVKKKVYITDREVRIVSSDEQPDQFSTDDRTGRSPVILVFTKRVDENINGTLHGVISELYLSELEISNEPFRESTRKTVQAIVARALVLPEFHDRDVETLTAQCKRIIFLRTVWLAKQFFYDQHPDIRPPYAVQWSSDPNDKIKTEQQIEFYAHAAHNPVEPTFARFVMPLDAPGMELPFFSPPLPP